jgi:hypothetical protein
LNGIICFGLFVLVFHAIAWHAGVVLVPSMPSLRERLADWLAHPPFGLVLRCLPLVWFCVDFVPRAGLVLVC